MVFDIVGLVVAWCLGVVLLTIVFMVLGLELFVGLDWIVLCLCVVV